MGNEIFYCIQCGIRVRGSDFELGKADPRGERSYCAACLGVQVRSQLQPEKETSKRIRRVSSSSMIPARRPGSGTQTAVAARPRGTDRRPRKTGTVAVLGGLLLLLTALGALATLSRSPESNVVKSVAVPPTAPESNVVKTVAVPPTAPEPAADPLRAEFLRQLDGLKEQAFKPADPDQGDRLLDLIADAVSLAARLAPERRLELLDWQKEALARYEAQADAHYDEIAEAAMGLAEEGRSADALAKIRVFPKGLRHSHAWTRLEALERQIQSK